MRKGGRESPPFFSCFHDAFRFAALEFAQAREGHASQGALMADLVHLSSVFSALRAIGVFKTKETILFLRRTVNFSRQISERETCPDLWAQCGQRSYRMSQSEGNEINEWQVQKSA